MLLLGASICPRDPGLEVVGPRLLDCEPPIRERLRIVSDETQPAFLFSLWDPVWFGQNTCNSSVDVRKEGGSKHTDGSFPLGVVLFCDVMCALVLKIRCIYVSIKMEKTSRRAYFHR